MLQKVALVHFRMKLLSFVAFVVLATTIILTLSKTYSLPQDAVQTSAERRALSANDASYPLETNPMNPFLSIKPFIPAKPTFVPPFVNPDYFINQKAALLNDLFGGKGKPNGFIPGPASGNYFLNQKAALLGNLPSKQTETQLPASTKSEESNQEQSLDSTLQRRLVMGPPPPIVDPKIYADKKADFLNKLFNSLSTPTEDTETDADINPFIAPKPTIVPPDFWSPFSAQEPVTSKPTIVPPSFWYPFIPTVPKAAPIFPVKPTIVPPSFWSPFASLKTSKTAAMNPFKSLAPPGIVDPSVFINKKTAFLNKLFETLQTTPAPPSPDYDTSEISEEIDPASIYEQKVSEFLGKLYNSLVTTPAPPLYASSAQKRESENELSSIETRAASQSPENTNVQVPETLSSSVLDAKDNVVETILEELVGIKNNMLQEVADLIKKQKETIAAAAASAAAPPFGKAAAFGKASAFGKAGAFGKSAGFGKGPGAAAFGKPTGFGKPFASPFASMWAPTPKPKPTPDPLKAYEEKFKLLNDLFETLTKVEKDVSKAVNKVALQAAITTTPIPTLAPSLPQQSEDISLYELIKNKIQQHLANTTSNDTSSESSTDGDVSRRGLSPDNSFIQREISPSDLHLLQSVLSAAIENNNTPVDTRSIKMAVHQGYQSLPPGSEEIIQAGGGGVSQEHEGGGLRLQGGLSRFFNTASDSSQQRHHHHNHH